MGTDDIAPEPQDCVCGHADWLHTAYLEDDPGPPAQCDVADCPCTRFAAATKETDGR